MANGDHGEQPRFLLITANVGSLFEDISRIQTGWVHEIVQVIKTCRPAFLALHMQEIGGKEYRKYMHHVNDFVNDLQKSCADAGFLDGQAYVDEDMDDEDNFTALGAIYLCHRSIVNRIRQFDFRKKSFHEISGFRVHRRDLHNEPGIEKRRFPKDLFPGFKWSRKGFMCTRWRFDELCVNFVNIHLFHDACNLQAVEQSPSVYSSHRKEALQFALGAINETENGKTPMFIFGDFNFRLDVRSLIETLAPSADTVKHDNNGVVKLEYRKPKSSECILSIGTKTFEHGGQDILLHNNLLQFDKELKSYPHLFELPITFPPSYPYSEDADSPTLYMNTRAPAWCDRVVMNEAAWKIVQSTPATSKEYGAIGHNTCMGDHKPIYLTVSLPSTALHDNSPLPNGSGVGRFSASTTPVLNDDWKHFVLALRPTEKQLYDIAARKRDCQVFALRIESMKFALKHAMASGTDKKNTDFITMVTVHDDHTVTVMDASSYEDSSSESFYKSTSVRAPTGVPLVFTVNESEVSDRSSVSLALSRRTSSTFSTSSTSSLDFVDSEEEESSRLEPRPLLFPVRLPGPPPPSPDIPKNMRLFESTADAELVTHPRRRPNATAYSNYISVKDARGQLEVVYAMPSTVTARKPPVPPRQLIKSTVAPNDKSVQVEFNQTVVSVLDTSKEEALSKHANKSVQTEPTVTEDHNTLANELERRERVGLSRWAFDERWDIVREFINLECWTMALVHTVRFKNAMTNGNNSVHDAQQEERLLGADGDDSSEAGGQRQKRKAGCKCF